MKIVPAVLGCIFFAGLSGCDTPPPIDDCTPGPLFYVSPIAFEDIRSIVPLGSLNPEGGHIFPTRHLYFYLIQSDPNDPDSPPNHVPVYAPGDCIITSITRQQHLHSGFEDYQIRFICCAQVAGYFLHMQSLSDRLKNAWAVVGDQDCRLYDTGGESYLNCSLQTDIKVAVGEIIGTAGGPGQYALDFGLFDARIPALPYANPNRVEQRGDALDDLHLVCPMDYFEESIRVSLEDHLGSFDGTAMRLVSPRCGEIVQDVPGTAQGKWFAEGISESIPEDPHLALVHDNIDPAQPVFSVGNSIPGLPRGRYTFAPQSNGSVNRDFKDISGTAIYTFSGLNNAPGLVILLRLTSPTTLQIEAQYPSSDENGPYFFTENAARFER